MLIPTEQSAILKEFKMTTALVANSAQIESIAKEAIEAQYGKAGDGFMDVPAILSQKIARQITESTKNNTSLFREVTNTLWYNYDGGDSAAAVATKIFAEIGLAK